MSRCSSDNVLGGIRSPSGVRKSSSRSGAFFSLGLKPRMPSRTNVALIRLHRRAKTDRLDTELLKRAFLGWLRGERDHCKMVAIPTIKDEDGRRPNRERESLVGEQSRVILNRVILRTHPARLIALR